MNVVDDILVEIEALQRLEALQNGVDYRPNRRGAAFDVGAEVLQRFGISAQDYLNLVDGNARKLQALDQTALSQPATAILDAWAHITALIERAGPLPGKLITPKLFSVGLGTFSAICVRDKHDRFAIGIDDDFLAGLFMFVQLMSQHLEEWAESGYIAGDYDRFLEPPLPTHDAVKGLGLLLDSVVSTGGVGATAAFQTYLIERFSPSRSMFATGLWFRICCFMTAHEYAHFLHDHHLEREPGTSWRARILQDVRKFAGQHYSHLKEPSAAQIASFLDSQADEYQADDEAHDIIRLSWRYTAETSDGRRYFTLDILAMAIFFAYCDSIERLVVLRMRGKDPEVSPLFREHALVANLFLRGSHPSPFERHQRLMHDIGTRNLGGADRVHHFIHPVWNFVNLPIKLELIDRKHFSKSTSPELVARKWKSRVGLRNLISNLWPDERPSSLAEDLGWDLGEVKVARFW
jgi:hypothetical protein